MFSHIPKIKSNASFRHSHYGSVSNTLCASSSLERWWKGLAFWELEERKSNWWKECSIDYYSISIKSVWVSSSLLCVYVDVCIRGKLVENYFLASSSWYKTTLSTSIRHTLTRIFKHSQTERSFGYGLCALGAFCEATSSSRQWGKSDERENY